MDYLDFEIEIGAGSGRQYAVSLLHSPAGEARGSMLLPFDELALESHLKDLQIALLRSGGMRDARRSSAASKESKSVKELGQSLFDSLVSGEIRNRYDVSQQIAVRDGKGLRLKLRFQTGELASLPWEFLYDPRQGEFICLSTETPVVRYIELPIPVQAMTITPPLRVLGMVARPSDLEKLDVDREKERVNRALKGLIDRGVLELTWLEGQTWRDLQRALRTGTWHVFHFIGHGGYDPNADEGFIALADEQSRTHQLSAAQLGRLLADHNHLRLALLNSCEGARTGGSEDLFASTASVLVRRGLPAVLAMQYEISDRAAIEFSRSFYEALADGVPVDAAVSEARKAISLAIANTVEWGTPSLFMRAADGVLFNVKSIVAAPGTGPLPAAPSAAVDVPSQPLRQAEAPPIPEAARKIPTWGLAAGGVAGVALIAGLLLWGFGAFGRGAQPTPTVPAVAAASATERPTATVAPTANLTATTLAALAQATPTPTITATEPPPTKPAVQPLTGPLDRITSMAWSRDGSLLAVGSLDGSVRVWNASTWATPQVLQGHTGGAMSLAWSHDGTRLATASRNGIIRLWDTATWNEFNQLTQGSEVTGLAWSPDGTILIVATNSFRLQLWNPVSAEKTQFFGSSALLSTVLWHDKQLITASSDQYVRIWNASTGSAASLPPEHTGSILVVAWSPDGSRIASGGEDTVIWLWDALTRKSIRSLTGHTSPVRSISWSMNGQTLASASEDGTVRLWDVSTGDMQRLLETQAGPTPLVAWSPTNNQVLAVAAVTENGEHVVRVWDLSVP